MRSDLVQGQPESAEMAREEEGFDSGRVVGCRLLQCELVGVNWKPHVRYPRITKVGKDH